MKDLYRNLKPETLKIIEEFKEEALKKIVYTSFDGDDMNHMLQICRTAIENDRIPLNPEMALGYYDVRIDI